MGLWNSSAVYSAAILLPLQLAAPAAKRETGGQVSPSPKCPPQQKDRLAPWTTRSILFALSAKFLQQRRGFPDKLANLLCCRTQSEGKWVTDRHTDSDHSPQHSHRAGIMHALAQCSLTTIDLFNDGSLFDAVINTYDYLGCIV